MTDSTRQIVYAAAYKDVTQALTDLDAIEQLPGTGSTGSRSSAGSPTSTTSPPNCRQDTPTSYFRAPHDPGRGSDAGLGLHTPGGDRVGECRVVASGLVGVGFAEFGHGLVEGV